MPINRRRFLSAAGTAGLLALTGCLGSDSGSTDTSPTTTDSGAGGRDGTTEDGMDGMGTATTTDGSGGSSIDHPAAAGLAAQPRLGDLDGHAIIAFEDPSCSRCRAFERKTVPKIKSELVDAGKAAFVFRGYPVVYPWGEPAAHALEATFDQSADAFWSLLAHYFETQREFSTDNVLDRTQTFLAEETSVDGERVVNDVEADAYADAVQADLDAGRNADLGEITPIVVLFNDGEYVTKANGSVSYDLIATALGEK